MGKSFMNASAAVADIVLLPRSSMKNKDFCSAAGKILDRD
jgi:hypothetical protein